MKLRDVACDYADRGLAVLPLKSGSKQPLGSAVPHGLDEATTDLARVFRWWRANPTANIGIACEASGLVVLDVDPRNGGDDTLWELEDVLGHLPATPRALSGGMGAHILFRHPGGGFRREIGPGVDVKANGYIVAPPSLHPSGRRYEWEDDPADVPLADVPERWLEEMRPRVRQRSSTPTLGESDDPLKRIPAHAYVPKLTGRTVEGGWVQCPFHKNGEERTPSFSVNGTLWACYACDPLGGRSAMGGNVFDLAALLWGYAIPLTGPDFAEVRERLRGLL